MNRPLDRRPASIFLTGSMGSGKSSTARLLAGQLGRPLVDIDAEIEAETGQRIAELFATEGEASFRRREAKICAQVAHQPGLIVALGGGSLLDPESRERICRAGQVICLWASEETLLRRLSTDQPLRPLLGEREDEDLLRARLHALLSERRAHYESFSLRVRTDDASIETVVDRIYALLNLSSLEIER